ncbi:jouberin-like isoform X1 [Neodiprion virginianus]|uniref:jouberin-like isoform X1 n=2 Tax=Neodiprion virginianus TaxID=2961670 RepID=UPI001EE6FFCD|nr:jouberin-like isoform X1 [Neodiprion virginianus]XP_046614462.1 jouberin-like isoform X1 [Neodiprion virginianus]XP_046614463.1 jouberin-like isoform X1 [Neodiprion virginianus]XP_046614464.1 jouberin-like isoform X1 [Neodiprion virginianus]
MTKRQKSSGKGRDSRKGSSKSLGDFNNGEKSQSSVRQMRRRPATSGKEVGLSRSERILCHNDESIDSGDSNDCLENTAKAHRPLDVIVVDVHSENKEIKLFKPRNIVEDANVCWLDAISCENKANPPRSQRKKSAMEGMAWEIEESIDTIQEFAEDSKVFMSSADREPSTKFSKSSDHSNSEENYTQLFGSEEKILRTTAGNSDPEPEPWKTNMEAPKRRRKRWSKGEKNLHLTQELIANSSDTNRSVDTDSHLFTDSQLRPVPAPRKKKFSKSLANESSLVFDNAAFRSDAEEVLRIETEVYEPPGGSDNSQKYRQSTKIEMSSFYDSSKSVRQMETNLIQSKDDFSQYTNRRDNNEVVKVFEVLDSGNSETEIHDAERDGDPGAQLTPIKSRQQLNSRTTFETSEFSKSNDQVLKSAVREKKIWNEESASKRRPFSEDDSANIDTSCSLMDITDLPRSRSAKKDGKKSKYSRREVDSAKKCVLKSRSSSGLKNTSTQSSKDDSVEYNADKSDRFISITIHKADVLETDFITRHPMVKVHIVDMKTGNYLKTAENDDHERCGYLQPMITGKFDFKKNKSIVPNWEEELIFDYNFDDVIRMDDKPTLILFEVLDLLNFAEARFNYNILGSEGCWHKIAWAFLRPVGVNGTSHMNKKVRLQLYQPSKASKKSGRLGQCEVFNSWKSNNREKYPSTLYVTLKPVELPVEDPVLYDHLSLNKLPEIDNESCGSLMKASDLLQLPKWTRLAAQSCKIPNNHLFQSETFENGCFYVTFSNSGKYLACVGSEDGNYPIIVYTVPEGMICVRFIGHKNFVYGLNWSNDDKYLLSVSSDQTACIWDVRNKIIQHIQMLPHPSYVYCGKFYPRNKDVVVTGCCDSIARVWMKGRRSKCYELTQELDEHKGYVNSICFQKDGGLITADSVGVIILWTLKKAASISSAREWNIFKIIKNNEIENIVVNTVLSQPLESRILVHSRDNGLRMIDLATGVVLQRYKSLRNRRLQITACLSPCGGFVLCGGEDSYLNIWNVENGKRVAKYLVQDTKIVACVAYHPFEHILAFSTFGSTSVVHVMNFSKNSTGESVGLSLIANNEVLDNDDDTKITVKFGKSYATRNVTDENPLSRQELLRQKLERLDYSKEGLKSRSAARLNNIIEKIDKILVNTALTRHTGLTCSLNDAPSQYLSAVSPNAEKSICSKKYERNVVSRSQMSRSRDKSLTLNTDATVRLRKTSGELIEMQDISLLGNDESTDSEKLRKVGMSDIHTENRQNISSCSDMEFNEIRSIHRHGGESFKKKYGKNKSEADVESNRGRTKRRGSSDDKIFHSNETCIITLENLADSLPSDTSTPGSTGTYIVDKKKDIRFSMLDKSRVASDSGSSAKSSITFTVENEVKNDNSHTPQINDLI